MMLKQCLLVCVPPKELFDDWSRVTPTGPDDLCIEYYDYSTTQVFKALRDYLDKAALLSPAPGDQSCAGAQLNWQDKKLIIRNETPDSVLNPPNQGSIRYFFFDPRKASDIARVYGEGFVVKRQNDRQFARRFERISAEEYAALFGCPPENLSSLLAYDSCIAKAFWKAVSGNQGFSVTLDPSADVDAATGWIRPIVIRLNLEKSHYNERFEENKISPSNAFHKLLNSAATKCVQPILPRSSDARWRFFQKWWDRISFRLSDIPATHFTAIERLVFRPCIKCPPFQNLISDDCPWYPFFILDHLGGSFHVTGFGDGKGSPEFWWYPPTTMPSNLKWFAEYWVKCWGGKLGDSSSLMGESFGAPCLPRAKRRRGKGFQGSREEIAEYANSVEKTLRDHPASDELGLLQSFLVEIFASPELQGAVEFEKLHKDSIEEVSGQLYFYPKLFLESACRAALLPASPIRIQPPLLKSDIFVERHIPDKLKSHVEYENTLVGQKAFDIIDDSGGGAEAFLHRAITANPQDWGDEPTIVPFPRVWWLGKWVDLATSAPSNAKFYLEAKTTNPFVLGDPKSLLSDANSLLGDANLGQSRWAAEPAHNVNIFYT